MKYDEEIMLFVPSYNLYDHASYPFILIPEVDYFILRCEYAKLKRVKRICDLLNSVLKYFGIQIGRKITKKLDDVFKKILVEESKCLVNSFWHSGIEVEDK